MKKNSFIRNFEKKEGVFVFDDFLNEKLSSYDSEHLEELAKVEPHHFWFTTRSEQICNIFNQYVDKKSRVLEIGAGTGFIAEKLQRMGYSIEASDGSLNGLLHARKRGIRNLYQFDLFNPPFKEQFDVICLFDVLEHLKDDKQALEKLKQMLKPGGKIILTVPAHMFLWSREDAIAGHARRYSKKNLDELFKACNLYSLCLKYFFTMILPFLLLRKWIRKDQGTPIEANERFKITIPFFFNKVFYYLTKSEFLLGKFMPNVAGGSLIAVAQKENLDEDD